MKNSFIMLPVWAQKTEKPGFVTDLLSYFISFKTSALHAVFMECQNAVC